MFYLLKRVDEKQCTLGDVCMVLADFSGIKAGRKGVITEIYNEGVMVTWETETYTVDDIRRSLESKEMISAGRGFFSDGFSRDELEYLGFRTDKHPRV